MSARLLFVLPLLLLAACQAGVMLGSGDSSISRLTGVKLLQPLTVAPDTTRVFIQDGRVLAGMGPGYHYRPQCAFEVRDRMESPQTIQPASFRVIRVQDLMDEVVRSKPLQVAMLKLADMDDGGAPMVHAGYHFWFEPNESTVRRMSCYGVFTDMPEVESPTIADIRQALGEVAELTIRPNQTVGR